MSGHRFLLLRDDDKNQCSFGLLHNRCTFFLVISSKSELHISGTRAYFFFELVEIGVTYFEVHVKKMLS